MKNIYLEKYQWTSENPFQKFLELKTIWEQDLTVIAQESFNESQQKFLKNYDEGEIFLIKENDNIIGITGYFPNEENYENFSLRWHGILPKYQKKGISQKVLQTLLNYLIQKYENFSTIQEFMPIRDSYQKTEQYFLGLGFQKIGNPEKVDWSESLWQTLEYKLPEKKLQRTLK